MERINIRVVLFKTYVNNNIIIEQYDKKEYSIMLKKLSH